MRASAGVEPALRLVRDAEYDAGGAAAAWFCGHCAAAPPDGETPGPMSRVCASCGLGVLLETRHEIVPDGRDAFLVVDQAITVQALSCEAERLLMIDEDLAINRAVTELLVPAYAEPGAGSSLPQAITAAVAGDEVVTAYVRPWNTYGVRLRARVATCGPPRAALVVLDSPGEPVRLLS